MTPDSGTTATPAPAPAPLTAAQSASTELAFKIAKLVEERGWNQEEFARICRLNRHTVRQILSSGPKRRLRNNTVSQCATALNLTVNELRTLPLERLLPRMHGKPPADEEALRLLHSRAVLPELISWLERNADRTSDFRPDEITELLDMQGDGGPLARLGVEHCVEMIERRRELLSRVRMITSTEFLDLLEQVVGLVYDKLTSKITAPRG